MDSNKKRWSSGHIPIFLEVYNMYNQYERMLSRSTAMGKKTLTIDGLCCKSIGTILAGRE